MLFHDHRDPEPAAEYTLSLPSAADYIPGQFYRRELPCILALIEQFEENPHEMMVDGYVTLGDRPGLGLHLFESFQGKIPVIGVAKSPFRSSAAITVLRGRSRKPLYVTSAGVDTVTASKRIIAMHGPHRVPSLLKHVDLLARKKAYEPCSCGSC